MGRKLLYASAAAGLLALAACGGGSDESAEQAPAAEGSATPAAGAAPAGQPELPAATTAQGFAARAAVSDMFEIQSSQLALERSQNPQVRQYAQRMVNEHQTMTNQMQAALAQAGVTVAPPSELDAEKGRWMQQLRDAGPGDFDERYIEVQTEAHESALNLFRDYAGNGDTPVLKELANRGAPMIENHLQTVKAIELSPAGAAGAAPAR